jgi:hypothetical protein
MYEVINLILHSRVTKDSDLSLTIYMALCNLNPITRYLTVCRGYDHGRCYMVIREQGDIVICGARCTGRNVLPRFSPFGE